MSVTIEELGDAATRIGSAVGLGLCGNLVRGRAGCRAGCGRACERIGAQLPLQPAAAAAGASFDCATARRAVEKVICADARLSALDRDIGEAYARLPKSAASDSRRAALRDQQRDFIATRNASFGRPDYDLRAAMEKRLEKLRAALSSAD